MSSIMRGHNRLMALSVMAMSSYLKRGYEPHDLETGRAILFIPTSNPPRARSRWVVYRESGLVLGSIPDVREASGIMPSDDASPRWKPGRTTPTRHNPEVGIMTEFMQGDGVKWLDRFERTWRRQVDEVERRDEAGLFEPW